MRAVGGLAHYIEEAGIPTTQISLIREHTQTINPPRALWVPFDLGRPLGVPNNTKFQTRVLKHVLGLLELSTGPVLEDYPEDAPETTDLVQVACPVSFGTKKEPLSSREDLLESFSVEFSQMKSWYDLALAKRKRTTTGVSGLLPEDASVFLAAFVRGTPTTIENYSLADSLRMAAEDIKAFYLEGVLAQPGQPTDSQSLADWFWGETYAALVINEIRKISLKEDSDLKEGLDKMKLLGTLLLVPRSQMHRFKA
ncbi:MAG: hypothetical protein PF503_14825 [Desulfobacula sp.]|jgi:hypothetical protein|nr:hypothetical protein [Desulfobacula sp.]